MKRKKKAASSKKEEKSGERVNQSKGFPGWAKILVIISILILLGYFVYSTFAGIDIDVENDLSVYNGFPFEETPDGFWKTVLRTWQGDQEFLFYYHPLELEELYFDPSINPNLSVVQVNDGALYISVVPEIADQGVAAIAGVEISRVTSKVFGIYTRGALTEDMPGHDGPVASCSDASPELFVVELRVNGTNEVLAGDFCAVLYAEEPEDLIKLADLFVYKAYGVMDK